MPPEDVVVQRALAQGRLEQGVEGACVQGRAEGAEGPPEDGGRDRDGGQRDEGGGEPPACGGGCRGADHVISREASVAIRRPAGSGGPAGLQGLVDDRVQAGRPPWASRRGLNLPAAGCR